ncbi:WD40 repeat domain-containing protein, partial [Anabaena sp. CS-542/02]
IKLWDVRTGKLSHTLTGHSDWVRSVGFSPDGQTLASGSYDKTIKIWPLR